MFVKYFMTTEVFTLCHGQTCLHALRELTKRHIRRAPVLAEGQLVGIVSERDLFKILPGTPGQTSTKAGEAALNLPVNEVMTPKPKTLHPNDTLESAAQLMLTHKVGGIPVVEGNKIRGIITESDIFKALWRILSSKNGCRVIFEEAHRSDNGLDNDLRLCLKHQCMVNSLLRYPVSNSGNIAYLCIEGKEIDALLNDLWKKSKKVLSVKRNRFWNTSEY